MGKQIEREIGVVYNDYMCVCYYFFLHFYFYSVYLIFQRIQLHRSLFSVKLIFIAFQLRYNNKKEINTA